MNIHDYRLIPALSDKFNNLQVILKKYQTLALAFSGGVDSSFLLAAAKAAGVGRIFAVTVVSEFFTGKEVERAKKTAKKLEVEHLCIRMDVFAVPEVVRNGARRCYHCKHHSFSMIKKAAAQNGITNMVHGINVDDLGDYRPGIEAAKALGFDAPLVAADFSKAEIRECARVMGLDSWDLPSQSCLATRIPMGETITQKSLDMVAQAEDMLYGMGMRQVRVRCHHDLARIELLSEDFSKVLEAGARQKISCALKDVGFKFVALDLGGYETGKMNPGVDDEKMREE